MPVRLAAEADLSAVNRLRRQVNDIHVLGEPEIFKAGFPDELRDHVYRIMEDPYQDIAVCERDGAVVGFAVLHRIEKPETPFMLGRVFLDIDEFCVDEAHRRTGVGTELMDFIKLYAREKGLGRIELNMWEFNSEALAFYESAGFVTYRRYMELNV